MVVKGDSPANYLKIHQKYGKIVRVGPNHVSVSDPSMIPVIYGIGSKFLKTPFYTTFSPIYRDEIMHSMFSTRDPEFHKALKTPVAQLFSMTNIKNYEPYADECSKIFINAMKDLEGQAIDLGAWLHWYAFDVIASLTYSKRFGFLEERRDTGDMIKALEASLSYTRVIGQFPGWHKYLFGNIPLVKWVMKTFPINNALERFLRVTEDQITAYDQEEKENTGRTDFLAQLREKEAKDGKIGEKAIVNHISNNILAGSDTTAISLRSCFYYLIRTPHAYKKLIAEIDAANEAGQLSPFVTYEECLKMPYLQAVMKEAMRIHPGVGFPLERYIPEGGATICDVYLPAGTNISVCAPVIHLDKSVFGADAGEFRPERWLEAAPEELKLMNRSFLAFGHGARTCIGKNISIMEMGKMVPQIFRNFDIEWASEKLEWRTDTAWFYRQYGIIARLKSRQRA
ncbi:cytochrome P450 [Cadophora sp. DSE1049]|nr:cytochrome P450 [Cadophora sp. DSE1049]